MKKLSFIMSLLVCLICITACHKDYDAVKNDPLKTRIYTLENGLKVYMSVNKDEPRIQTMIAVKVGSKNDPAETTGLAHYFEHLMFKGTENFGTSNYEAEKPMLDQIEQLFEVYRKTTDEAERAAIYHQIDSISYEASKLAIPNEYDKLMAAIGAEGTNAFTSFDQTCYVEDIPSNQIENWAKIQADRFKHAVIRGFHTELETIYEEYNMSLTRDYNTAFDTLLTGLFPHHPYGTQTTLGTQNHLKNPSITNVKNYYKTYYVPNNMAICLSGDFDPDKMIEVIKKNFGDMQPNHNLPKLEFEPELPLTKPVEKEVVGLDASMVFLSWRLPKANADETDYAELVSSLLSNGSAGLIDLDLVQKQKILEAYAYNYSLADYGIMCMHASPKEGQTLENARDLLLTEMEKIRKGDFDEQLLKATIDNYRLNQMQYFESNMGRVYSFADCFINDISWESQVNHLDRLSKITKDEIVKFANEWLKNDNYVVVYKREGKPDLKKMEKPAITPIVTNRDTVSNFLKEIQNSKVEPIEPVFVDFQKDMERTTAKSNIPVLYKKNETNGIFNLYYVFETGSNNDATLNSAFTYIDYLGTSTQSAEQIKQQFYNMACSYGTAVQSERSFIYLTGLSENMDKAMALMEELLSDAQPDTMVLQELKSDIVKARMDAKLNQSRNFAALRKYAIYGADYIQKVVLSNEQLAELKAEDLIQQVQNLLKKEHTIMYYGPQSTKELVELINKNHRVPATLEPMVENVHYMPQMVNEPKVYLAQYDAKQIYYAQYANRGIKYDVANDADIALYNEYFGGGMNSIVFQEMREARSLAYSASAWVNTPGYKIDPYYFMAFIATQNDKMIDAVEAFANIIDDMPESEAAFTIAKESMLSRLRTQRTIKESVLWAWMDAQDMGVDYDRDKVIYEKVQNMTLANVKAFQEKWVKGSTYAYCILGDIKDLNTKRLGDFGPIEIVEQKTMFGY